MKTALTMLQLVLGVFTCVQLTAQKSAKLFTENNRTTITMKSGEVIKTRMEFTWEMVKSVNEIDTVLSTFSNFENRMIDYPKEFRPTEKNFGKHLFVNGQKYKVKDIQKMEVVKSGRTHKFLTWETPDMLFSKHTLIWCSMKGQIEVYAIDYCMDAMTGGVQKKNTIDRRYFLLKHTPQGMMTYSVKSNEYTKDLVDLFKEIKYLAINVGYVGYQYENMETLVKEYNQVITGSETILSRRYGKSYGPSAQTVSRVSTPQP
jgi:hypothetical protein